ncbi:uncharacterized protein LOC134474414 isoform X2 [Cavia porcellus]|uniref:uncharacterized protein LOC134474414 isoform X2 n=1 Tax=Cavia porcellus TaxID=10141 RepID=UPI002FE0BAB1
MSWEAYALGNPCSLAYLVEVQSPAAAPALAMGTLLPSWWQRLSISAPVWKAGTKLLDWPFVQVGRRDASFRRPGFPACQLQLDRIALASCSSSPLRPRELRRRQPTRKSVAPPGHRQALGSGLGQPRESASSVPPARHLSPIPSEREMRGCSCHRALLLQDCPRPENPPLESDCAPGLYSKLDSLSPVRS